MEILFITRPNLGGAWPSSLISKQHLWTHPPHPCMPRAHPPIYWGATAFRAGPQQLHPPGGVYKPVTSQTPPSVGRAAWGPGPGTQRELPPQVSGDQGWGKTRGLPEPLLRAQPRDPPPRESRLGFGVCKNLSFIRVPSPTVGLVLTHLNVCWEHGCPVPTLSRAQGWRDWYWCVRKPPEAGLKPLWDPPPRWLSQGHFVVLTKISETKTWLK